tara:strand:- start:250 stop:897 length:648 start_codon:yes stop_codon:yes gene_type:complete
MKLIRNEWAVRPIHHRRAKDFVEEWHYSKGGAKTAVSCYGLYRKGDPLLQGISWWMPPPLGAAKSVSPNHRSVLSLSRFCLRDDRPENAGSFLISKSIKMLDNRWDMLLTYADTALNHDGGLYRASNWNYNGLSGKNPMYWDPINDCMVSRKRGPKSYSKKEMLAKGYEHRGNYAKHRFIYRINNRKGLIVNSRTVDELVFNSSGQLVLFRKDIL